MILLCFVPLVLFARQRNEKDSPYVHSFAVQVGVDVGGGVPVPFSYSRLFFAFAKVLPSIGVKYAFVCASELKLGELTYKHI